MREHNTEKTIAALILAAGRSSRMQHGQESYHKLLLPLGQGTILSHVIVATLASQARPIILILGYQSEQIRATLIQAGANSTPTDDIIITENAAYAQGMSTSLHKGIQILMNQDIGGCGDGDRQGRGGTSPTSTPRRVEVVPETSTRRGVDGGGQAQGTVPTASSALLRCPFPTAQCDGALVLLGDQPLVTPALLNQLIEMKYTTGKRIIAPFYNGKRGNPVLFDADLFPELLTITGDEGGRSVIEKHRAEMGKLDIDDSHVWYDVDTWEAYQQIRLEMLIDLQLFAEDDFCYLTTTGRVSGRPHTIEIWFGLHGKTLYMLAGGRYQADWVKNIQHHPDVQVKLREHTFSGKGRIVQGGDKPDSYDEDLMARQMLLDKYAPRCSDDLEDWSRTSLPIAVDLTL